MFFINAALRSFALLSLARRTRRSKRNCRNFLARRPGGEFSLEGRLLTVPIILQGTPSGGPLYAFARSVGTVNSMDSRGPAGASANDSDHWTAFLPGDVVAWTASSLGSVTNNMNGPTSPSQAGTQQLQFVVNHQSAESADVNVRSQIREGNAESDTLARSDEGLDHPLYFQIVDTNGGPATGTMDVDVSVNLTPDSDIAHFNRFIARVTFVSDYVQVHALDDVSPQGILITDGSGDHVYYSDSSFDLFQGGTATVHFTTPILGPDLHVSYESRFDTWVGGGEFLPGKYATNSNLGWSVSFTPHSS